MTGVVLLSGCSSSQAPTAVGNSQQVPTATSPQQVQAPAPTPKAPPPRATKPPPPQAPQPGFNRGQYLAKPSFAHGGGKDALIAQYGKFRVEKARVIRDYAPVSVVPIGLDAFLKSYWDQGFLHIRIAMVGPEQNLQMFVRDQREVKVSFTNEGGVVLKDYVIPMTEFHKARESANFGTPTFEFESNVEIPLELYEQFYQWTFEWD